MEYTLKCGNMTAVVCDLGGELISLKDGSGKEYIWCGDPAYWSGRNPHLFPTIGATDPEILIDGVPYPVPRHGFVRTAVFSVAEQGRGYIVFQLKESENILPLYPFPFTLSIRHQLTDRGFFTRYEVTNTGVREMPFCIGGHTAFNCPMNDGEAFPDYRVVFDEVEDAHALIPLSNGHLNEEHRLYALCNTHTLALEHENFAKLDTYVFEGLRSKGVSLLSPNGHGVHMDFSDFPIIAIWTAGAKKAPYLCLEPWQGCPAVDGESGEFKDKRHCILLSPGETRALQYTVDLI